MSYSTELFSSLGVLNDLQEEKLEAQAQSEPPLDFYERALLW